MCTVKILTAEDLKKREKCITLSERNNGKQQLIFFSLSFFFFELGLQLYNSLPETSML